MRRCLAVLLLAVAAGAVFSLPAGASLRQIAVGNFYFEDEPDGDGKIDAQVGDQLRFNVLDGGPGTPHTVEVDELGIHSGSLGSGETFTTPPIGKAGTFILYCKPHDQRGHVTTLVVSGTSITPPPTAPTTTTTQPPTTTTTQASTTTKPPATTTTTARPAGAVSSSSPTTTAPRATTTTAPPTSTSGTAGGSTAPTAGGTDPATTSGSDPALGADGTAPNGAGETALAPTGRGRVDDALAGSDGTNLDALLERMRGRHGPWTRSLRLSLAALVPMALAAALALRRWPGPPPADDAEG